MVTSSVAQAHVPAYRRCRRSLSIRAAHRHEEVPRAPSDPAQAGGALALAAVLVMSTAQPAVELLMPLPANASDESYLTPSERRKLQAERRQALLDKVRQDAEQAAAASSSDVAGEEAVDAPSTPAEESPPANNSLLTKKLDTSAYDEAVRRGPRLPAGSSPSPSSGNATKLFELPSLPSFASKAPAEPESPAVEAKDTSAPRDIPSSGASFFSVPTPAAPAPPPAAEPEQARTDAAALELERQQELQAVAERAAAAERAANERAQKAAAEKAAAERAAAEKAAAERASAAKGAAAAGVAAAAATGAAKVAAPAKVASAAVGKRSGPLPLWLAQLLVLSLYGGLVVAFTVFEKKTNDALGSVGRLVADTYKSIEKKLPKSE